jgi:hypothetical protein
MDSLPKNRRRHPRLARSVRFLFYFLGQTREVYTADIGFRGAFLQTDLFPSTGSFIILEHFHLKKRDVTLGLVGQVRRIQTPQQSSTGVRGIGVEWIRAYCNQGFLHLKQFFERDLGFQPFDWETHLAYESYEKKIIFDFTKGELSPTPMELESLMGSRQRTNPGLQGDTDRLSTRTRPIQAAVAPQEVSPGGRPTTRPDLPAQPQPQPAPQAQQPPVERPRTDPSMVPQTVIRPRTDPGIGANPRPRTDPGLTTAPRPATDPGFIATQRPRTEPGLEGSVGTLLPVEIKAVFGIGNRMFYGVVRGINERAALVETSSATPLKAQSKVQVRLPLNARNFRYMVVVYGSLSDLRAGERENLQTFILRIQTVDEFQNPGGFRFFIQNLAQ